METKYWFEDDSRYRHVGSAEFGLNNVYDFEVYLDKSNNSIVAMCHDDPEEILELSDLIKFSKEYSDPKYAEQRSDFSELLQKLTALQLNEATHKMLSE